MSKNCTVILAAGKGTRMKSGKPKVLCEVLFKPMIDWVIDAAETAESGDICVVTGHLSEQVEEHLKNTGGSYTTVFQKERLGTGHAVKTARDFIAAHDGNVLILNGDAPLMDSDTIRGALEYHERCGNAVTVISAQLAKPAGYGRIVRDMAGFLQCITEEKDADEKVKRIHEVNSGAYWFKANVLVNLLERINKSNVTGEYYLTQAIALAIEEGLPSAAYTAKSADVVLGANDREQLLDLNNRARRKVLRKHMLNGLDIPCDSGVIIGPDVIFGEDTKVMPGTIIRGESKIGSDTVIGPNSVITDSVIGSKCHLNTVYCTESEIGDECTVGPFVNIRAGTKVGNNVHLGNFVELKNSSVKENTKIAHLTYIGDTDMGANVNVGCGCVTVNYDGNKKYRTVIKDNAFIGCNTNLIAPVTVGFNAYTAAGSTVDEDVPDYDLAIARSRQINKKEWAKKKIESDKKGE